MQAFQNRSKISNRHQRKSHSLKRLHQPLKEVVYKRLPSDIGDLRCPQKKDDERMRSEPLIQQAFFS
jgi:hypothetical protein